MLATSMTWVRAPGLYYFPYYFAIYVPMQCQHQDAPYAFKNPTSTCPWRSNQRHRLEAHHKPGQSANTLPGKGQTDQDCWARILGLNLLFGDYHPPWFAILYIFLIFYFQLLFYFLYCFELINYFHKI